MAAGIYHFCSGFSWVVTATQSGILSPQSKSLHDEKVRIGLLLESTSAQTWLHQESLSIMRNGGTCGEQIHVWFCTWKNNCLVLLAEKQGLSGFLDVAFLLFFFFYETSAPFSLHWGTTFPCGMRFQMKCICITWSDLEKKKPWVEEPN